jgi:hypothetical protein
MDHAGHYRCRAVRGALLELVLNERLQVSGRAVFDNAVGGKGIFALVGRGLVRLALQSLLQQFPRPAFRNEAVVFGYVDKAGKRLFHDAMFADADFK